MNQMNGIGSSQQFPAAAETVASQVTSRTARSDAGIQTSLRALGRDQTDVSVTASAASQAFSGSEVRMDRVTALQGSIEAGTYSVPASYVASKLMSALMS